jgi:hypothetical protein
MPAISEIIRPRSPVELAAAHTEPHWKHKSFAPVAEPPAEPPEEPEPILALQPAERVICGDLSDIELDFIADTGASPSEAEQFLRRAQGDLQRAIRLHSIAELAKKADSTVADPDPFAQHILKASAAIAALPANADSDAIMEDAPSPAADLPSIESSTEAMSSHAGIITSEAGTRLVPRSVRLSGTVRNEINIRPGYVPPEDKEVYKVRRGGESMSRSTSESRSRKMSLDSSAAATRVGTPATPTEEGEGFKTEKKVETRPTLEWYEERIKKGEDWKHVAVLDWEGAFKMLGVSVKK